MRTVFFYVKGGVALLHQVVLVVGTRIAFRVCSIVIFPSGEGTKASHYFPALTAESSSYLCLVVGLVEVSFRSSSPGYALLGLLALHYVIRTGNLGAEDLKEKSTQSPRKHEAFVHGLLDAPFHDLNTAFFFFISFSAGGRGMIVTAELQQGGMALSSVPFDVSAISMVLMTESASSLWLPPSTAAPLISM